MAVCSTAFTGLARAQSEALSHPDLPIAVIPHPFGIRTREEIKQIAGPCAADIVRLASESAPRKSSIAHGGSAGARRAELIEAPADLDELNKFFLRQRWSDGLPVIPPTAERVARMVDYTRRAPDEIIATIAPAFGAATVESIAINAVLAGCYPEYMPVLIAAVSAMAAPEFNLRHIQTTTNPAAVWLVINGPIAKALGVNSGINCLGPGNWANATLGRALRLIEHNIGGGLPGDIDRASLGQPGKYTFCCAENELENPWEPLHVERGFARDCSTVTVVGALSPLNTTTHAKNADNLLRVLADTMAYPMCNDYVYGGEPWLVLTPELAHILQRDGLSKDAVKRRLWDHSKLAASRLSPYDIVRTQSARRAELGEIGPETLLPVSARPENINILVAGGPGTHSAYIPVCGNSRSVTREVALPGE